MTKNTGTLTLVDQLRRQERVKMEASILILIKQTVSHMKADIIKFAEAYYFGLRRFWK